MAECIIVGNNSSEGSGATYIADGLLTQWFNGEYNGNTYRPAISVCLPAEIPEVYTLELFCRIDSTSQYGMLMSTGNSGINFATIKTHLGTGSDLTFDYWGGSSSSDVYLSVDGFKYNTWYTIGAIFDRSSNTIDCYLNGIYVGRMTPPSVVSMMSTVYLLRGYSQYETSGKVMSFRAYTRALSASEMLQNHTVDQTKYSEIYGD